LFGLLQGLPTIIDAAAIVAERDPRVRFVLAGDGVEHAAVSERVKELKLDNVRLPGRVPLGLGAALLERSDAALLHLHSTPLSATAVPSKLAAYLFRGKPVIVAADGAAAALAREAGAGPVIRPGHPGELAEAIIELSRAAPSQRTQMGSAARSFYDRKLARSRGMAAIDGVLSDLLPQGADSSVVQRTMAMGR
jgi:hypothetical protein